MTNSTGALGICYNLSGPNFVATLTANKRFVKSVFRKLFETTEGFIELLYAL
jgi:hypothetical protein